MNNTVVLNFSNAQCEVLFNEITSDIFFSHSMLVTISLFCSVMVCILMVIWWKGRK